MTDKPKLGRPFLPDAERRDQRYVIKLTPAEKELLAAAGDSAWARGVLVRAAKRASHRRG